MQFYLHTNVLCRTEDDRKMFTVLKCRRSVTTVTKIFFIVHPI